MTDYYPPFSDSKLNTLISHLSICYMERGLRLACKIAANHKPKQDVLKIEDLRLAFKNLENIKVPVWGKKEWEPDKILISRLHSSATSTHRKRLAAVKRTQELIDEISERKEKLKKSGRKRRKKSRRKGEIKVKSKKRKIQTGDEDGDIGSYSKNAVDGDDKNDVDTDSKNDVDSDSKNDVDSDDKNNVDDEDKDETE